MDNSITISATDLLSGIADSKHLGVEEIRNLDLYSDTGVIKLAYRSAVESGSPSADFIQNYAIDPNTGRIYLADNSGTIKRRNTNGTYTNITGNTASRCRGIAVYNDYLFFIYNSGGDTKADRYGPISGSPSWTTNWGTIASGYNSELVPTITGQDNILYLGVGNNVVSINSSFTINTSALDLPEGYVIQSMTELRQYLMIGAVLGNDTSSVGDIFPWDRVSPTFTLPIRTGLPGVPMLVTKNNQVYAMAGKRGTIVATNSVDVERIKKISQLTKDEATNFNISNGCVTNWQDGILWGLGKTSTEDNSPCGLWYYRDGAWQLFTLSIGDGSSLDGLEIGCVVSLGEDKWLATWYDQTGSNTYGVDVLDTSKRAYSVGNEYNGYFVSKMYNVGTRLKERVFQNCKFQFAKPLESNQGIKLEYRLKSNDSWTEIDTFYYGDGTGSDRDNIGAITSFEFAPNILPAENIQFKVSMRTASSGTSTPELLYVIFE